MRSPRPHSTRIATTAAVLAVLLTGATTALLLHSQPRNGRRRAAATTQVTPRRPRDHASTAPAAPPAGPPTVPAINLAGWRWADFHGIALPASAHDGPRHTRGGLASGFTDTPAGALLAAVNIAVRTAAEWGPAIYTPTITSQVTGPDTAALLQGDTAAYAQLQAAAHTRAGQPAGRGYAAVAAYRFAAYSPAAATVDIITAGPASDGTTVWAATRIEAVWDGADWHVTAPPGASWANSATAISSLSGYTVFPGER
jgi:hypothetical protein